MIKPNFKIVQLTQEKELNINHIVFYIILIELIIILGMSVRIFHQS